MLKLTILTRSILYSCSPSSHLQLLVSLLGMMKAPFLPIHILALAMLGAVLMAEQPKYNCIVLHLCSSKWILHDHSLPHPSLFLECCTDVHSGNCIHHDVVLQLCCVMMYCSVHNHGFSCFPNKISRAVLFPAHCWKLGEEPNSKIGSGEMPV